MNGCGWEMVMIASAAAMPAAMPCQTRGLSLICQVFGATFDEHEQRAEQEREPDGQERVRAAPACRGR